MSLNKTDNIDDAARISLKNGIKFGNIFFKRLFFFKKRRHFKLSCVIFYAHSVVQVQIKFKINMFKEC